jgi:hypothetical protein
MAWSDFGQKSLVMDNKPDDVVSIKENTRIFKRLEAAVSFCKKRCGFFIAAAWGLGR